MGEQKKEWLKLLGLAALFAAFFWLPVGWERFDAGLFEALYLARDYARAHVLLCLVPALFIAGAIAVFISQASVMRYLGAGANKMLAYGVASVSGSALAACSCTVLPLFAGIHRLGAGLGPAVTFLYAGPAINVLAIVLTARVLGWQLGLARAAGAVGFALVIGLIMHLLYGREEQQKALRPAVMPAMEAPRPLRQTAAVFAALVAILVFANWARSGDTRAVFLCCPDGLASYSVQGQIILHDETGLRILDAMGQEYSVPAAQLRSVETLPDKGIFSLVYLGRWFVVAAAGLVLAYMLWRWYRPAELREWVGSTWAFTKQIVPLLFAGVLVAGFLLGRPGHDGLVPGRYVQMLAGGTPDLLLQATGWTGGTADFIRALWPVWTSFFASIFGAFMYFATLTEVPIVQALRGSGMAEGPALALLLAGPALSLPNMLVIGGILGARKTLVFVSLVVVMATVSGIIYGAFF